MAAFDRPWQVVGLIGLVVVLRVVFPRIPGGSRLCLILVEFSDSLLLALLVVFCVLRPFVVQAFYIPSGSMEPTLYEKDRILVLKLWYHFAEPRHSDIVVFRAPKAAYYSNPLDNSDLGEQKDFIKRLIGCPHDRLRVANYTLWRNGQIVNEPYIKAPPLYSWPRAPQQEVVVPPGRFVVFGDNRNNSNDSHRWVLPTRGHSQIDAPFISREALLGKAWVVFWPLHRARVLH
ncbi:MAG: signal peptidase I [Candidatus Zipacnadales bacterium]